MERYFTQWNFALPNIMTAFTIFKHGNFRWLEGIWICLASGVYTHADLIAYEPDFGVGIFATLDLETLLGS
jgi:hypothetical protein